MLRSLFFVALFAGVLCSCGGDPTAGEGSRGDEPGGRSSEGVPPEETSSRRTVTADEETAAPAPTTTAVAEPEPPEDDTASSSTPTRPALGTNGMVSSAHPLATRAGLEVLEDGGNAFDAAVAVAASLSVVEPYMSGVGGSGATVIYDAQTGETRSLSAAPRAPESLDPGVFRPPTDGYRQNRVGAPAISTPGAVNDWEALWEEYGELGWGRLLEPAIRQAEGGFVLDEENAGWIGSEFYSFPANAQRIYGDGGSPSSQDSASCRRIWVVPWAESPSKGRTRSTAAIWARR